MSEIVIGNVYKVEVVESERGYSRKKYFSTKESAEEFVESFNSFILKDCLTTPDFCVHARYCGKIQ